MNEAVSQAVTVHIEELVLHGFAPGDRYRIAEAVQAEVTRLVADGGLPTMSSAGGRVAVDSLDVGSFAIAAGARPERIGAQIGATLYGGLGGNEGIAR